MKLFLLQLREEFRRLRPILPIWVLCLILMSVWATLHATRPAEPGAGGDLFGATPLAVVLLVLIPGAILAKTIGTADPALAPDAAWAPRPLRGGTLAAAKLTTIVLLVLLPPAFAESLVIGLLFGPGTLPAVWGYYLVVGFAGGVVLVAMSALAGSWDRFAWVAMSGLILTVVIAYITNQCGITRRLEPSLIASRIVAVSLMALAGGTAVLFDVYLRRRPREAYVLTLAAFLVCQAGLYAWSFDFYRHAPEKTAETEAIRITTDEALIVGRVPGANGSSAGKLRVTIRVENLPQEWTVAGRTVRWADVEGRWHSRADLDVMAELARAVATGIRGEDTGVRETRLEFYEPMTPELEQALDRVGGRLRTEFEIDFYSLAQIGELPLGETGTTGPGRIRVRKLDDSWSPGHVQTGLLYALHQPLFDVRGPLVRSSRSQYGMSVALVDDQGARLGERGPYLAETGQNEMSLMPFAVSRRSFQGRFPLRADEINGVGVLRQLENEAVVFMYSRYEGSVIHEVSVQVSDAENLAERGGDV